MPQGYSIDLISHFPGSATNSINYSTVLDSPTSTQKNCLSMLSFNFIFLKLQLLQFVVVSRNIILYSKFLAMVTNQKLNTTQNRVAIIYRIIKIEM